ncbi:hypothetical protein EOPP23_15960 [Endozoicomonas sp. OPT23]|uniref:LapA family protein n=1 Tax=Endozoicomonas sp. OPT23 TaxID=2072845 RepID=UPI00129BCB42|nr:LapA family protein [Endozoicomonas sp. OPT23]MRI34482.1 hypothetical protein [Endozoicomonas sp. OPT23]
MVSVVAVWLKRMLLLLGVVALLIALVNFVMVNPQMVQFQFAGSVMPEIKASSVAVIAFIVGGLAGLLVSMFSLAKLRLLNASYRRKLGRRDAEIHKLRSDTLKGLS